MNGQEYEPGMVAIATVRGRENVRVFLDDQDSLPWHTSTSIDGVMFHGDHQVTDIRPLVVLDLVNAPTAEDVCRVLREDGFGNFADPIEAQTKPARILEPGKYGVVVAAIVGPHPIREEWVSEGKFWRALDSGARVEWANLADPELIREGVES